MPLNLAIWNRIQAVARRNNLYPHERTFQDQTDIVKMAAGSEFIDGSIQAAIYDQTNVQINRLQRYKDYEQMDQGEMSLALDLYADTASLVDPERKHTLIIKAKSKRVKRELEDLYFNILQWDSQARSASRYVCKFGDCPYELIPNKDRTGIASIKHMNVYNFTRVETKHGDLVGFYFQDDFASQPVYLHPWQVMHLRLTSLENIYMPYGVGIMNGSRKPFKQLRLMEDGALIYRITRAPEKRKFTIPVGQIPNSKIPEYIQSIARTFKRQRFYNPATGSFDERYSPIIQEDDFYLPRRPDGTGPDIDTLPGAENLDQIKDIEYFKKKMISPLKIPFSRVGIGDAGGQSNGKSLASEHDEFAKAVQWIQREIACNLKKVGIVHLALRGYSVSDIESFDLMMPASSAIEELYRMETWQTRVSVMADLKDLGWFSKEWIVTHFTDLTPDEIIELNEMTEKASAEGEPDPGLGGGGGFGGLGGGGEPKLGDLSGDEGLDSLAALGDEDGGDKPEDGGEKPDELGGNSVEESLDRYNSSAIKQLIKNRDVSKLRNYLVKLATKLGKDVSADDYVPISGLKHMTESHELDGLNMLADSSVSRDRLLSEDVAASVVSDYNIDPADRDEALRNHIRILVVESNLNLNADDDISVDDVASATSK